MVDGRSPEQIDRVLGRWQRLLSGLDADTRIYFYMIRRPASPEGADDGGLRHRSGLVAEAECVSGRPRAATRSLFGLVARSPSPGGRRRARIGQSVPVVKDRSDDLSNTARAPLASVNRRSRN